MKSNAEWEAWGKRDPLFAVASWKGKGKSEESPWTDEEFYRLGEMDWTDFKQRWNSYGIVFQHCLGIGCGAGRITNQLGKDFQRVTATDVSADQIAYAKPRIQHSNVTFALTTGADVPLPDGSVDAVFSCHVFQHFDSPEDAERVFSDVFRVMSKGSSLCIHLPMFALPRNPVSPVVRALNRISKTIGSAKANFNRARGKLIMRGLWYEKDELIGMLKKLGFSEIETHGFEMRSNQSWHDVVFASKRA
jgi:ubiquinone/menaquinone biosynthesis C-methylase UbiE